jgi:tungstate transport system substrate-binding protein
MTGRHLLLASLALVVPLLAACGGDDDDGSDQPTAAATASPTATPIGGTLILATTTSTQDSGLLDLLIPDFEKQSGYTVLTIAVGTGQALKMGEEGNADVLLVHAPASEKELMDKGFGKDRAEAFVRSRRDVDPRFPGDVPAEVVDVRDSRRTRRYEPHQEPEVGETGPSETDRIHQHLETASRCGAAPACRPPRRPRPRERQPAARRGKFLSPERQSATERLLNWSRTKG